MFSFCRNGERPLVYISGAPGRQALIRARIKGSTRAIRAGTRLGGPRARRSAGEQAVHEACCAVRHQYGRGLVRAHMTAARSCGYAASSSPPETSLIGPPSTAHTAHSPASRTSSVQLVHMMTCSVSW